MEDNKQPEGRINPTNQGPVNPAKYFAEWSSTNKCFKYWDNAAKKDVLIPLPFTFIPVAKAICIKGYNEPEKCKLISNEVDNPTTDPFKVFGHYHITKKKQLLFNGLWADISKDVKAYEGAWTESIYIGVKGKDGKLFLANLQLNGSGITHWFEFLKSVDIWSTAIQVKEFSDEKKGSNKYVAPVFSAIKIKKETDIEAAALQKEILEFLKGYYAKNAAAPTEQPKAASVVASKPAAKDTKSPFKKGGDVGQHVTETEEEEDDIHTNDGAPDEF